MSEDKLRRLTFALLICCAAAAATSVGKCRLKYITHKARQTDQSGHACEDEVRVRTCGGYCLSSEVPHWQFPYKQSRHPVCQHDRVKHRHVILANCHPKADPGTSHYHFVEAASCKCKVCSSENTSCEWLPPGSSFLHSITMDDSDEHDDNFSDED